MKLKVDKILFLINGRTQKEISDLSGISRNWLGTTLKRGYASMNVVNKLAKALDVDPKEIVKLED